MKRNAETRGLGEASSAPSIEKAGSESKIVPGPALAFDFAGAMFCFHPALPRASWGSGFQAGLGFLGRLLDQLHQPVQGIPPVRLLGSETPGLDDQNPVLGDPPAREAHEALPNPVRQGWREGSMETKLYRTGHFVYVLPAGT